ncbi:MAG: hypothetical protein P8Y00_00095 [Deltaproteobacteria bacterium]
MTPMSLDYEKLEAAFRRNKRPMGVSVPAVADMRVEALLVGHQLDLWRRAAEAVFREVQVTDSGFMDFAQRDIQSLCARMYNRYSGLTALSERLKANYEKNNESHKRLFLRAMNQAIGTSVADLLSDGQSAAEVQLGVDRSVGLITTLSQEMAARLGKEIMWAYPRAGTTFHSGSTSSRKLQGIQCRERSLLLATRQESCFPGCRRSGSGTSVSPNIDGGQLGTER